MNVEAVLQTRLRLDRMVGVNPESVCVLHLHGFAVETSTGQALNPRKSFPRMWLVQLQYFAIATIRENMAPNEDERSAEYAWVTRKKYEHSLFSQVSIRVFIS